jgi:hypothetical protein
LRIVCRGHPSPLSNGCAHAKAAAQGFLLQADAAALGAAAQSSNVLNP